MKLYLASLIVGLLVGVLYGLLGVRSPAPPVIALIGLAGILAGERLVPLVQLLVGNQMTSAVVPADDAELQVFRASPRELPYVASARAFEPRNWS